MKVLVIPSVFFKHKGHNGNEVLQCFVSFVKTFVSFVVKTLSLFFHHNRHNGLHNRHNGNEVLQCFVSFVKTFVSFVVKTLSLFFYHNRHNGLHNRHNGNEVLQCFVSIVKTIVSIVVNFHPVIRFSHTAREDARPPFLIPNSYFLTPNS